MKINYSKLINVVIFTVIIIILFTTIVPVFHFGDKNLGYLSGYNLQPDTDSLYRDALLENSEYKSVQAKLDSIRRIADTYEKQYMKEGLSIGGLFGIQRTEECDTCSYTDPKLLRAGYPSPNVKFYLRLSNYAPVEDSITFIHKPVYFKKKGTFYKKFLTLDKRVTEYGKENYLYWTTHKKEYGIDHTSFSKDQENRKTLLIPISKIWYNIFMILSFILGFAFLVLFLQFFLKGFILLVYGLSKGEAFTQKNYMCLFGMAYVILGSLVFIALVRLIMHLVYKKYFAGDFSFYFDWQGNAQQAMVGLIILLLARAMKKGYIIQQEQDLTI